MSSNLTIFFFFFLSIKDSNIGKNFNCISMLVYPDERYATIDGLTRKYPCVGVRHKDILEIYPGPKLGEILIKSLLQYCDKYRDILRIDRLELGDMASFPCGDISNMVNINLNISNILIGKRPYYMRFGFM